MAGLKIIRRRIKSVNNTKKITYAMKLVSAAKLRKAQEAVGKSRDYTMALKGIVAQLAASGSEFVHPLMIARPEVRNVRLIVIGGNRGLCGGFNANLNRQVEAAYREFTKRGHEATSTVLGRKPAEYFRKVNRPMHFSYETLSEDAAQWPIEEVCMRAEQDFLNGSVDEVHIVFTRFKSVISSQAVFEQLLPLDSSLVAGGTVPEGAANVLFEPSAEAVYAAVVPRILRSIVRQAALETKASEYGARMAAMDAATKNAGELSVKLRLKLNKLRQGNITGELLDILGGVNAQS